MSTLLSDLLILRGDVALGAAMQMRPEIRLAIFSRPNNMLQVQCLCVLDDAPVKVSTLYIRILNEEGLLVYPVQPIAKNQAGFVIEITLAGLKDGHYYLQASNHQNFSPIGVAEFDKAGPEVFVLGAAFNPGSFFSRIKNFFRPNPPVPEHIGAPISGPDFGLIPIIPIIETGGGGSFLEAGSIRYVTEEDDRVCNICEPLNGELYDVDDDARPEIPQHPNCRCWYEFVDTGVPLDE